VIVALVIALTRSATAPDRSSPAIGAMLLDDFSAVNIDPARWEYRGSFTATLDSPVASIENGRANFVAVNDIDEFYDGGLYHPFEREVKLVSARVTLQDATGFSDLGLEVNGLDDQPDSWAYLAMNPSDGTVSIYVGHDITGTEQSFTVIPGSGLPATHEFAIGWDETQATFYVDGVARKSLPTQQRGQWAWLLFDVEPKGQVSGSFDDVRVTYVQP
jgi:hypothetical protein